MNYLKEMDRSDARQLAEDIMGAVFLASGSSKLIGLRTVDQQFEHFGYPRWFRLATGAVEVATGLSLLGRRLDRRLAAAGSLLACGTMLGAVWTHVVRAKDPAGYAAPAATLAGLSGWAAVEEGSELVRS